MKLVVDASVASKWFLAEVDSLKAWGITWRGHELCAPSILRVEIASAITRQVRVKAIDVAEAERKLDHMLAFVAPPTLTLVPDEQLLSRAVEVALQIRHPLQDCLYVACAEAEQAELVTADATLLKRAAGQFSFVRAL